MGRVYANGPGDLGSKTSRIIPKTLKMVLDTYLLNTQQYKVRIKSKVEQSRERSSALPLQLSLVAIEKGAFGSPTTTVANFTFFTYIYIILYIIITYIIIIIIIYSCDPALRDHIVRYPCHSYIFLSQSSESTL